MTPTEIKHALADRGYNLKLLARALEVTPGAVSLTLNRKMTSFRIAGAIAKAIGRDLREVFPEYKEIAPLVSRPKNPLQKVENLKKIIA